MKSEWPSGRNTTALKSNDALWRNGSCSAIVLTATTGNCRARWAVEATGNEYHPWPLRCQPFYRAARPRTGEGGLNGAPIPDEKSCRSKAPVKKTANKPGLGRYGNLPGPGPGRPKGVPNKFNGQLKEALLSAFNGAHPDGLASWVLQEAKANPTAGLALLGRLIHVSTQGT